MLILRDRTYSCVQSQRSGAHYKINEVFSVYTYRLIFTGRIYITVSVLCVCVFQSVYVTQIFVSFQDPERASRDNLGPAAKLQVGDC